MNLYLIKPSYIEEQKIGNVISISANELSEHGLGILGIFKNALDLKRRLVDIFENGSEITDRFIAELTNESIPNVNLKPIIKELILEKVRREIKPNLPSRLSSIYLCKRKDIYKWADKLNAKNRQIYEVLCTDYNLYEGDEFWWHVEENWYNCAKKYWTESSTKGVNHLYEVIYQGTIKIINVFEDLESFKKSSIN